MTDVTSVMTANPSCCKKDTPLQQVAQMMIDSDCGMIPVVDHDDRPVGAVTDRDITVRIIAAGKDAGSCCAGDAMTAPIHTIASDSSLYDATCLMEAHQIRRLIIVDGDGKLAGIAAIADLSLAGKDEATAEVVKKVSKPGNP